MRWLVVLSVALAGQSFERDLQPVFRKHCYNCHASNVKIGSLDVETHSGLMRGGNQGPVVVPGKAGESRLYLTLTGAMEPVMPMGGKRLGSGELEVIRKWIDAGARADAACLGWGGGLLVSGLGGAVREVRPGGAVLGNVGTVRALAVSADGRRVAAGGRLEVRVWEAGKEVFVGEGGAEALAFARDGRLLAVRDGAVWDVLGGGKVRALEAGWRDWAFSPDGKRMVGLDGTGLVRIFGERVASGLEGVTRVAWGGERIAAGMEDGQVWILRAGDLAELGVVGSRGARVTGLAFSGDGLRLAVLREDGGIWVGEVE